MSQANQGFRPLLAISLRIRVRSALNHPRPAMRNTNQQLSESAPIVAICAAQHHFCVELSLRPRPPWHALIKMKKYATICSSNAMALVAHLNEFRFHEKTKLILMQNRGVRPVYLLMCHWCSLTTASLEVNLLTLRISWGRPCSPALAY